MRDVFSFSSFIVLDLYMPQETELSPVSRIFINIYFASLYLNKTALIFVLSPTQFHLFFYCFQ